MFWNPLKKTIAAVMTGAMMLSLAGCLDLGGDKKAVIEAADTLASYMKSANAGKLIKNSTLDRDSDEADMVDSILDDGKLSKDQNAFSNAVEDTIEYEIDEKSCKITKNTATVDIIFTLADYTEVLEDEYKNVDALVKALKKADTFEYVFTAEFEKDDKEWIPSNVGSKKFLKFYDYRIARFNLALSPDMILSFVNWDLSGFWLAEENLYVDTPFIQFDYFFDSVVYDYADRGIYLHFVLYKDGEPVYTSPDMLFGESTNMPCKVVAADVDSISGEFFDTGSYSIELCMPDGTMIDSQSVNVFKYEYAAPPSGGGSGSGSDIEGENIYFAFFDNTFKQYVLDAGWIDYEDDGTLTNDFTYSTDVKTIAFAIKVSDAYDKPISYTFSFAESEDGINDALQNPEYTGTAKREQIDDEWYYVFSYEIDDVQKGFYFFYTSDPSSGTLLMYGFCEVS